MDDRATAIIVELTGTSIAPSNKEKMTKLSFFNLNVYTTFCKKEEFHPLSGRNSSHENVCACFNKIFFLCENELKILL